MALLSVRQVSKEFPIESGMLRRKLRGVRALHDVSFDLEEKEVLALVGGSGSGKSTLAKIISGLISPDAGELLWQNGPLSLLSVKDRAQQIQMVFQDPFSSLNPKLSVETQLLEVVRLTGHAEPRRRCVELLAGVGLPADTLAHYPFQFSGGQRQRIAIARALALNPRLLVADEPLSALDVTTQAQMLVLLGQLRASFGLTILFITHDLAVAQQFSDRVIVLQEGRVIEEGATAAVLRTPRHPYTRALIDAVPRMPA